MNAFKSPSKVFDVSHPGRVPANPSSKPLIISNKPEIDDPMVAGKEDTVFKPPVSEEKTTEPQVSSGSTDNEMATESVDHTESVEVKESAPKAKRKTNPVIVIILILLILAVTAHALMNLGIIPTIKY